MSKQKTVRVRPVYSVSTSMADYRLVHFTYGGCQFHVEKWDDLPPTASAALQWVRDMGEVKSPVELIEYTEPDRHWERIGFDVDNFTEGLRGSFPNARSVMVMRASKACITLIDGSQIHAHVVYWKVDNYDPNPQTIPSCRLIEEIAA